MSSDLIATRREEAAEKYLKKVLWGYPRLLKRFFDDVRPALVEARDDKKAPKEKEKEEQEGRELGHIDIDPPHPTSDDGNETSSFPSTIHDFGPDPPPVTEIEVLNVSQAQPDDHLPCPPMPVVGNMVESNPTFPDASQQPDAPGDEERQQSHSEVDETPSASGNHDRKATKGQESDIINSSALMH